MSETQGTAQKGMTLIEVLVAFAILAGAIVLTAQFVPITF